MRILCQAVATEPPKIKKDGKPGVEGNGAPAKTKKLLSPEVAAELYRDMVLGREFEEMCAQMYYRGKMFGFVHLYSGQVMPAPVWTHCAYA